jgi:hypothetical protein
VTLVSLRPSWLRKLAGWECWSQGFHPCFLARGHDPCPRFVGKIPQYSKPGVQHILVHGRSTCIYMVVNDCRGRSVISPKCSDGQARYIPLYYCVLYCLLSPALSGSCPRFVGTIRSHEWQSAQWCCTVKLSCTTAVVNVMFAYICTTALM